MPKYKLVRGYWDGAAMHAKGAVKEFPEGVKPPVGARLVEEKPAPLPEKKATSADEKK